MRNPSMAAVFLLGLESHVGALAKETFADGPEEAGHSELRQNLPRTPSPRVASVAACRRTCH